MLVRSYKGKCSDQVKESTETMLLYFLQSCYLLLTASATTAQAHFAKHKPARSAKQQKAHREQLLSSVPEDQRRHLDDQLLSLATDLNLVQIF